MSGTYSLIRGERDAATRNVRPSSSFAVDANVPNAGLRAPPAERRPLFHVFELLSRMMNQQNISTNWFAAAIRSATRASAACFARDTPKPTSGRVCWPYSVIQIGTRRWYHDWSPVPNCWSRVIVTFGHATFWVGPNDGYVGYGCVAQASNLIFGVACARSRANVAGATDALTPLIGLSRPRFDVSPAATFASGFPALMPLYAAA